MSWTADALLIIVRKVQFGLFGELGVSVRDPAATEKEASRFQREITAFFPKRSNSGKGYNQQGNNTQNKKQLLID